MKAKLIEFINNQVEDDEVQIEVEVPTENDDITTFLDLDFIKESDDRRQEDFSTPLLLALIRKEKFNLATELINAIPQEHLNGYINSTDTAGKTALKYAKEKNAENLIELITQKGCAEDIIKVENNATDLIGDDN